MSRLTDRDMLRAAETSLGRHRATRPMTAAEAAELGRQLRAEEACLRADAASRRAPAPLCDEYGRPLPDRGAVAHDRAAEALEMDARADRLALRAESYERMPSTAWLDTERHLLARVAHYRGLVRAVTASVKALRAYHGDPALRASTLAQMRAHRAADALVQRQYWADGRGCAVGCLTHDPDGGHTQYPVRWGIPEAIAHLEDRIFEGLPVFDAQEWPVEFLYAIPLGADLSLVAPRFLLALLTDPEHGAALCTAEGSVARAAVEGVARLLGRVIAGEVVDGAAWERAAKAAVWAGGGVARVAANAFSDSAEAAALACAVSIAPWHWCRDVLLALLAAAPVPGAS
jgi:hypothetical protein